MKLLLISMLNFFIHNGDVVWQKTYSTSLSQEQFISAVKQSGLTDISIDGSTITGTINNLEADFKGAGYSEMRTSFYIARNFFNATAVITYSEGSYTVTLKNFILEYRYSDGLWQKGEKSTLNNHFLTKDKEFKKSIKQDVTILDYTFTNRFKFD